jgi:hypothetical protein
MLLHASYPRRCSLLLSRLHRGEHAWYGLPSSTARAQPSLQPAPSMRNNAQLRAPPAPVPSLTARPKICRRWASLGRPCINTSSRPSHHSLPWGPPHRALAANQNDLPTKQNTHPPTHPTASIPETNKLRLMYSKPCLAPATPHRPSTHTNTTRPAQQHAPGSRRVAVAARAPTWWPACSWR